MQVGAAVGVRLLADGQLYVTLVPPFARKVLLLHTAVQDLPTPRYGLPKHVPAWTLTTPPRVTI